MFAGEQFAKLVPYILKPYLGIKVPVYRNASVGLQDL